MTSEDFKREKICVCGFRKEEETLNLNGAKGWLSLTPAGVDDVPEKFDGIDCSRVLVSPDALDDDLAEKVVSEITRLPKPLLISCASGARASTCAWLYIAKKHGYSFEKVLELSAGEAWLSKPPLKNWVARQSAD
mmetsp:Transcript_16527/g.25822  ORF Transcript_16527/g.25822 Transcript_16527/m.25822 type:complete len:135 (-) Transcript_16527:191-595(-)|eukprot:CAMPEP_0196816964 /NCGR_PEP_ID=MMETSP1362-20130617/57840_1 /TAXON_ID=163516 /ORGANISM="Leptocylindrus danicus, Strain CCMP1856" /LENGTH=134 /DNA_ID=CAMNT_0042194461 /DNA_START=161 /DNA_END=565 /DNA_ORIENTATION=-